MKFIIKTDESNNFDFVENGEAKPICAFSKSAMGQEMKAVFLNAIAKETHHTIWQDGICIVGDLADMITEGN